jgi:hypothetical protein
MKFDLNSLQNELFHFIYKENLIKEVVSTKFLDLEIDKHMNWRNHILHMLPKLAVHAMQLGVCIILVILKESK